MEKSFKPKSNRTSQFAPPKLAYSCSKRFHFHTSLHDNNVSHNAKKLHVHHAMRRRESSGGKPSHKQKKDMPKHRSTLTTVTPPRHTIYGMRKIRATSHRQCSRTSTRNGETIMVNKPQSTQTHMHRIKHTHTYPSILARGMSSVTRLIHSRSVFLCSPSPSSNNQ